MWKMKIVEFLGPECRLRSILDELMGPMHGSAQRADDNLILVCFTLLTMYFGNHKNVSALNAVWSHILNNIN